MTLAMGGNILWSLILGQQQWWKIILSKKYLHVNRKRCLDAPLKGTKG
jgi:hypothetical protein